MNKVLIAFIILIFLGCEKEVQLRYDTGGVEKIVVGGHLSPQGSELFIRKLIPMGDTTNWDTYFLNDAQPILYQDGVPIDTFRNIDSLGHFTLSQNNYIVAGKEYLLKVKSEGLDSAEVHLQIPELMSGMTGTYESISDELGLVSYSFDEPSEDLLLVTIKGYDSLGVERQIYSDFSLDEGDCPTHLTAPIYIYPTKCLASANPRISIQFEKETRDWSQDVAFVNLHKIVCTISMIDGQYESMLKINLGEQLGFAEPFITETNVIGGYGVVLAKNTRTIVISF